MTDDTSPISLPEFILVSEIDELFENRRVQERAEELFEEGACSIHSITEEEVSGVVVGRTGVYAVSIIADRRSRSVRFSCTCPSDYYPCKHVGAFLYTVQAELDTRPSEEWLRAARNHAAYLESAATRRPTAIDAATGDGTRGDETGTASTGHDTAGSEPTFEPGTIVQTTVYRPAGAGPPADGTTAVGVDITPGSQEPADWRSGAQRIARRSPDQSNRIADRSRLSSILIGADQRQHAGHAAGDAQDGPWRQSILDPIPQSPSFKPAFKLQPAQNVPSARHPTYQIVPVLVYLRKDGTDGRIEAFSETKPRVYGNDLTEALLALAAYRPNRTLSALRILASWRDESPNSTLTLPVELFHQRSSRLERERPATPRLISSVEIDWLARVGYQLDLRLDPVVTLVDETGHRERLEPGELVHEVDERGLIVVQPHTGSLWYLFDRDLVEVLHRDNQERAGDLYKARRILVALAELLALPQNLTHDEASTVADLCDRHLADRTTVYPPPPEITVATVSPVPRVILEPAGHNSSYLRLQFRYGTHLIAPDERSHQLPLTPEELSNLGVSVDTEADSRSWIFGIREVDAEEHFLDVLIVELHNLYGTPNRRYAYWAVRGDESYFRSGLTIPKPVWQVIHTIGPALLDRRFEIELEGELLRHVSHTPRYHVVASGESWLSVEPGLLMEGEFVPVEKVLARGIVQAGGRLFLLTPGGETPTSSLERRTIGRQDLAAIDEIAEQIHNPEEPALKDYRDLKERLQAFEAIESVESPSSFAGSLRPYQSAGLSWLWFLHTYDLGGILADDMGLGKTVQTLALLTKARESGEMERALVVCPVSTMGNWLNECSRFAPAFSAIIHAGPRRAGKPEDLTDIDVILVGYETLLRDIDLFRALPLDYLILDEAQAVKNPGAKRRHALASLRIPHRLALTGTPVENSTLELWSILDLVMPGILGSRTQFMKRFGGKIMDERDSTALNQLERIIHPLILRRTKREVAPELPPREEQTVYADLGTRQASVYEALRARFQSEVTLSIQQSGVQKSRMAILEAMLRLRQAAILPALVDETYSSVSAAKLDLLVDLLTEIAAENNKALVFSQFTSVLDDVEQRLAPLQMPLFRLQGDTPQTRRTEQIAAFQDIPGSACFLISLRAGGLGINLTAADYVLLLDPWWNPAVEAQAIDRAHRIGRDHPVFAYRLVARGTIEEKMLRLQEKKRQLADALIHEETGGLRSLTPEDVQELFRR